MAFLQRPYPFEPSIPRRIVVALLFGLFVFAFLAFFEPFGIRFMTEGKLTVSIGFGLVSFLTMCLLGLFPPLLPEMFSEERWTVGKELLWVVFHLVLIGIGNAIYACYSGLGSWRAEFFLAYQGYTVGIGIFPVCISVLLREVSLSRRYRQESQQISSFPREVKNQPKADEDAAAISVSAEAARMGVTLPSDNKNEELALNAADLLCIESADNYVTVFYRENGNVKKTVLRSTLKAQEERLAEIPSIFRAHKSYLVNTDRIERVSGNAQGYRLHVSGLEMTVPVSRKQNGMLRERLGKENR
jgi:hypothetical protein